MVATYTGIVSGPVRQCGGGDIGKNDTREGWFGRSAAVAGFPEKSSSLYMCMEPECMEGSEGVRHWRCDGGK